MIELADGNDPILRKKCDVVKITDEIIETARDMLRYCSMHSGLGLAAPQIGLAKRFFVLAPFKICFNPVIHTQAAFQQTLLEGCLSLPGVRVVVPRPEWVQVSWLDVDGKIQEEKLWGLEARVFQHEYDHLEGKLITDYIDPIRYAESGLIGL